MDAVGHRPPGHEVQHYKHPRGPSLDPPSHYHNPKVTTILNSIISYYFSVCELYMNGLLQYVFFCVWLFSFKIGVRFTHIFF